MTRSDLTLLGRWMAARLKLTLRNPRAVVFTFAFPLVLVVLFNALNGDAEVTAAGGEGAVLAVLHAGDRHLQPHHRLLHHARSSASPPRARAGCSSACAARRCRWGSTSARG